MSLWSHLWLTSIYCSQGGITHANEFGTNNGTLNVFIFRFDGTPNRQVRSKRLRDRHSVCERNGKIADATTTERAFAVVTFNAYRADIKINCNVTKIKSENHEALRLSAAIVCNRDFLQSLIAIGEVNAGQGTPISHPEADFRAGPIEKR